MNKRTVKDVPVKGKRVLLRADLNVPLDAKTGAITDDIRIRAVLPTIQYLREQQARIILCSHLGRPNNRVVEDLRLAPVAQRLSYLLMDNVRYVQECVGPQVEQAAKQLPLGGILLLENIRFYPGEEANDSAFSRRLASLADVFVNDAFGAAHRAHASTVGVAHFIPAVAGLLMEQELHYLGKVLENPLRPLAAVVGGAKASDKLAAVQKLFPRLDALLIGGGMAATFLRAKGHKTGASMVEEAKIGTAGHLLREAAGKGIHMLLPVDVLIAKALKEEAETKVVPVVEIPDGWHIVDIGPRTQESFAQEMRRCRTIFWNGPMGIFEIPAFAKGTRFIAHALSEMKSAITVVGGGSTAEVVTSMGLADRFTHVSTGGGASLTYMEGQPLPAVAVLLDKEAKPQP